MSRPGVGAIAVVSNRVSYCLDLRGAAVSLHHAAACDLDAAHADALAARVPATRRGDGDFWAGPAARGALDVVAHGGCESHDLAGHLAQTGRLDDLLARAIEDAVNSH